MTRNQKTTLRSLSAEPCVLGCAEATARRMAKGTKTRPAYVIETKGAEWPEFALTAAGMTKQAELGGPL